MRKTDRLVLPLFDPDDRILREDFNQAAQTLDEKVGISEEICAILDLAEGATPADAFLKLALGPGRYAYILTVVYPDGTPVVNRTVSGVQDVYGNTPVTNENGRVVVIADAETVTVSVESEYLDLKAIRNQKVEAAGLVTYQTLCLEQNTDDYLLVTDSKTYELSPYVRSMDVTAVGGGGGSAGTRTAGSGAYGESGGGGGYAVHAFNYDVSVHKHIKIAIAAGGVGGKSGVTSEGYPLSGSIGGTTYVYYTEDGMDTQILTATGGNPGQSSGYGGTGNGNGGTRAPSLVPASSSTIHIFNDESLPLAGGGGGASLNAGAGGEPCGADCFNGTKTNGNGAVPGGGGSPNTINENSYGGSGGAGGVYFRFHFE